MSMSKTDGATCWPVANDVPVIAVLMNPVLASMHWPEAFTEPCSWYCQREVTGGCQHEPADMLQGTGAGNAAAACVADGAPAGPAHAAAAGMIISRPMAAPSIRPSMRTFRIRISSGDGSCTAVRSATAWPL